MTENKLKTIYLDVDGVLVSWCGGILKLFGLDPVEYMPQIDAWDALPRVLTRALDRAVTNAELWNRCNAAGPEFWRDLEWTPWGRELFALCDKHAPVVLMTTPSKHPSSAAGKVMWINEHTPKNWTQRFAMTNSKHHMAHPGAILIDDNDVNIAKFASHGGTGFLWPQYWNEGREVAEVDVGRVETLQQLEALLKERAA